MLRCTAAAAQPTRHAGMHEVVCVAAACKGNASLASGHHYYRVNTRGDHRRDGCANDRLVYYPPYDRRAALIKKHCVDNAIGLDGQLRCVRQPEIQSKVDVLGGPPATAAEAALQAEHWLNLARQIGKMAKRMNCQFLAMSDALQNYNKMKCTTDKKERNSLIHRSRDQ